MSATKAQEREALQKIRRIVEGLGEDSYIGTAFAGCFDIAESNILNDFACSMKSRAESAEAELEKKNRHIKVLQNELNKFNKSYCLLRDNQLSLSTLQSIQKLLAGVKNDAFADSQRLAGLIVEYAEDSTSDKFKSAVADHRSACATFEEARKDWDEIQKYIQNTESLQ